MAKPFTLVDLSLLQNVITEEQSQRSFASMDEFQKHIARIYNIQKGENYPPITFSVVLLRIKTGVVTANVRIEKVTATEDEIVQTIKHADSEALRGTTIQEYINVLREQRNETFSINYNDREGYGQVIRDGEAYGPVLPLKYLEWWLHAHAFTLGLIQ